MKTLENKVTVVKKQQGSEENLTYKDLIIHCINQIPQGGLGYKDIKERDRIMEAMDGVDEGQEMRFEDSDFMAMKKIIMTARWYFVHPDIGIFLDDIDSM